MNSQEAKRILALHRPGTAAAADLEMAGALEQARRDPDLQRWFEQHSAFQNEMRRKFQQIPVPAGLKDAILAESKIIRPTVWWRQPTWLAAAAAIVLLLGLAVFWTPARVPDRFADYRNRMVRTALREYRMDILTNDMSQVRQFMASSNAPADYRITPGLERLQLTGGGVLRWRGNPVSMVCFDRGDKEMLYLFVMKSTALKDAPPATPQVETVNKLLTVSWSQGDKTYVLAGPKEDEFNRKYL